MTTTVSPPLPRLAGRAVHAALRALPLAPLALTVHIVLSVLVAISLMVLPLGLGVFAVPAVLGGVRALANHHRRLAGRWSGVPVAEPYRPRPVFGSGVTGTLRRCRWLLRDPATWRDLLWLLLEIPVGAVLGLLPISVLLYGLQGLLGIAAAVALGTGTYGYGLLWPAHGLLGAILSFPQGAAITLLGLLLAGPALRWYAEFVRWLLGPTRASQLRGRISQLTDIRTEAVDSQAAELRRIERDLHDGAQARLVALGMSIGLAEELLQHDPVAARQLLAEAREAGGQALADLRNLVRGIHPPVLAERGLAGAVTALALELPLRVDVDIDLSGRPPAPVEAAAYFALSEALANVTKHSAASYAAVRLGYADGRIVMRVEDDGVGGADPDLGTGLQGIGRRLAAFDGVLSMTSPVGGPTVVSMELPCELSSPKTSPSSGTG
jgi:signal transduction histidine kinase